MADVPRKATPVAAGDVVRLLPAAFAAAGHALNREAAWLFLGLVFLENKRGASLFNHNWGNLAAGASWKGDVWRPEWYRQSDIDALPPGDRKTRLQDLHNRMGVDVPSGFRAYPTSEAGLKAFASLFKVERYQGLMAAALSGSPSAFAAAIKSSGYTPDLNVPQHTASYAALLREFERAGYFAELPSGKPESAAPAPAALTLADWLASPGTCGGAYVPLAFEATAEGAIHLARLLFPFRLRQLEVLSADDVTLTRGAILDVRVKTGGKVYSCLGSDAAVLPLRVFSTPKAFELPRLAAGDEIAIYVSGSAAGFVGWGDVEG